MPSMKQKAIWGTIWTIGGYGSSQALRLAGNLILTRLLVPELFGLMALVQTFITGLILFSDLGIRPAIIRSSRGDDPVFLNVAWTLQAIRGIWIWLLCVVIAWPLAQFYQDQRLIWLIPIVGLGALLSGFDSTSLATINRKVETGKLIRFEFIIQAVSLVVMVVWAYFRPSIWALLGGNLVSHLLKLFWSHRLYPEVKNRFAWDKSAAEELFSFGKWIFISTIMTFLAGQADRLILGRLFSLELLGLYTVAFTLADLPRQVMLKVTSQVMFPIISQYMHLGRSELREKILKKRWFLLIGLAVLVTILASFGDFLILFLYDDRYDRAAWMLPVLAIGLWPLLLSITINNVLFSIGKPIYIAIGNALKFIYMITLLPLAYSRFGIGGAIFVIAFNDILPYFVVNYGLWKEKISGLLQDLQATLIFIGLLALTLFARYSLGWGLPISSLLST
jgi:O-antigen/teichoic acid export membrane protein